MNAFVLGNRTKNSNEVELVRKENGNYSSELTKFKIIEINIFIKGIKQREEKNK